MKKLLIIIGISLAIATAVMLSKPKKSHCTYCYTGQCINSMVCGSGCVCLKKGLELWGECYSVD